MRVSSLPNLEGRPNCKAVRTSWACFSGVCCEKVVLTHQPFVKSSFVAWSRIFCILSEPARKNILKLNPDNSSFQRTLFLSCRAGAIKTTIKSNILGAIGVPEPLCLLLHVHLGQFRPETPVGRASQKAGYWLGGLEVHHPPACCRLVHGVRLYLLKKSRLRIQRSGEEGFSRASFLGLLIELVEWL